MRKLSSFFYFLVISLASCTPSPAAPVSTPSNTPNIVIPTPPACTSLQVEPTPGSDTPSLFPPESEMDHIRGAENPLITITEYSDYQDLRSGLLAQTLNRLLDENSENVRVVSRIFPLVTVNDKAALAAQAAEAAGEQDRFWEMHQLLYEQQENWVSLSVSDFEQWLSAQISALGMDLEQFQADLKREDIVAKVQEAW